MVKDMQRQLNHVQVLLDALVLGLSYTLAWYFAIWNPIFPEGHGVLSPRFYFDSCLSFSVLASRPLPTDADDADQGGFFPYSAKQFYRTSALRLHPFCFP